MARAATDFQPAFSPGEIRTCSFDFTPVLGVGETINGQTWQIQVVSGTDGSPNSHLIGAPSLTGNILSQEVGNLLAGVTYRIMVTVNTTAGQVLPLFSDAYCQAIMG